MNSDVKRHSPLAIAFFGAMFVLFGLWDGMNVLTLLREGRPMQAFVVRIGNSGGSHGGPVTILNVGGERCQVAGDLGRVGSRVAVHVDRANPERCVPDGGRALRGPVLQLAMGVLAMLAAGAAGRRREPKRGVSPPYGAPFTPDA